MSWPSTTSPHDYSCKKGVEHTEILAPEGAPAWVFDRQALWNSVETAVTLPTTANLTKQPDIIARYFLRRFALAQRKPDKPSVQFNNALADTIGVFVVFPIIGLASFILILSHRWAPNTIAKWFGLSPQVGMIAIVILSMVGGYWGLNKRLKQY